MPIIQKLAQLFRVAPGEVEAVLRDDEKRAREVLNRRRFMGLSTALASAPLLPKAWVPPLVEPAPAEWWPEPEVLRAMFNMSIQMVNGVWSVESSFGKTVLEGTP